MDVLILTRRPREVVMIGEDIQLIVLEIAGGRVRLGITAPREISVRRQEAQSFLTQSEHAPRPRPIP
jgi:carbon storage regulator